MHHTGSLCPWVTDIILSSTDGITALNHFDSLNSLFYFYIIITFITGSYTDTATKRKTCKCMILFRSFPNKTNKIREHVLTIFTSKTAVQSSSWPT